MLECNCTNYLTFFVKSSFLKRMIYSSNFLSYFSSLDLLWTRLSFKPIEFYEKKDTKKRKKSCINAEAWKRECTSSFQRMPIMYLRCISECAKFIPNPTLSYPPLSPVSHNLESGQKKKWKRKKVNVTSSYYIPAHCLSQPLLMIMNYSLSFLITNMFICALVDFNQERFKKNSPRWNRAECHIFWIFLLFPSLEVLPSWILKWPPVNMSIGLARKHSVVLKLLSFCPVTALFAL